MKKLISFILLLIPVFINFYGLYLQKLLISIFSILLLYLFVLLNPLCKQKENKWIFIFSCLILGTINIFMFLKWETSLKLDDVDFLLKVLLGVFVYMMFCSELIITILLSIIFLRLKITCKHVKKIVKELK